MIPVSLLVLISDRTKEKVSILCRFCLFTWPFFCFLFDVQRFTRWLPFLLDHYLLSRFSSSELLSEETFRKKFDSEFPCLSRSVHRPFTCKVLLPFHICFKVTQISHLSSTVFLRPRSSKFRNIWSNFSNLKKDSSPFSITSLSKFVSHRKIQKQDFLSQDEVVSLSSRHSLFYAQSSSNTTIQPHSTIVVSSTLSLSKLYIKS